MKILYLECFSGISGDMFISALLNAGLKREELLKEIDKLNLKDRCKIQIKSTQRSGVYATQFIVKENTHITRNLEDIKKIVLKSRLENRIKDKVIKMFERLYNIEKKIHRKMPHFHELGQLDTIIDIVGAIAGLKLLGIKKVFASNVNVGKGFVETHHGYFPVPAPATAELLKGIPVYSEGPETELVTPTGALILSEFVDEFKMPVFKIESIGYGAGTKRFKDFPNFLRVYIGEIEKSWGKKIIIETNIDDMNPEIYEYVMERLFNNGALDVYFTPIYMKKNRPGILLSCVCNESDKMKIIKTIFKETTTIGVRILHPERIELERIIKKIKTECGEIDVKISKFGSETVNITPEYESCKKIAKESGRPLKDIYQIAIKSAIKLLNN